MNIPGFSKEALAKVSELLYAEEEAQTSGACPPKKPKETQPQQPPTPPTPQSPAPTPPVQTQTQKDEAAKKKKCTPQSNTTIPNPG
jgi:hypothetical protein